MDANQFKEFMEEFKKSMGKLQQAPSVSSLGRTQTPASLVISFEPFDKSREKFTQYKERFQNYAEMKGFETDQNLMKQIFLNSVGSETYQIAKSLVAPKSLDQFSYKDITDSLQNVLSPKPNVLVEQHRFLSRVQKENESISDYVIELRKYLDNCEFNCKCGVSVADLFLKAQFVRGILSTQIREKLLTENKDFKELLAAALLLENSKNDNEEMKQPKSLEVNKLRNESRRSKNFQSSNQPRFSRSQSHYRGQNRYQNSGNHGSSSNRRLNFKELGLDGLCLRCGRNNHVVKECRADRKNLKCNACNRTGHLSKVCVSTIVKQKRSSNVQSVTPDEILDDDIANFNTHYDANISNIQIIDINDVEKDTEKYFITIDIENQPYTLEVDCGCGFTLIPESDYQKFNITTKLSPAEIRFRTYDKGIVEPLGTTKVSVQYKEKHSIEEIFVVPDGFTALCGRSWIRHLNIQLQDIDNNSKSETDNRIIKLMSIDEIKNKFKSIFEQRIGKIPDVKVSLKLRENARPKYLRPRDVPFAIREAVEKELIELEEAGVISKIEKSDWGSPIVPVAKPGNKVRLCGDYKVVVNPQLIPDHYPIPRIDETIYKLREASYFCKLDLFKAYLHIEVDSESSKIQAISTHLGTYSVNRLGFGINVAPGEFHRVLSSILEKPGRELKGVINYFDDIIVYGNTIEECETNLLACLERLQENNLHLNIDKCQFFKSKITYLGYIIEKNKIRKDSNKIKAVLEAPRPKNEIEVKQFLGFVSYYSKFIPNASTLTYPLRRLLSKRRRFRWTAECEAAFIKLKEEISSDRVLVPYDPKLPISVACDASPTGIAGVLSHNINGIEKPVAFVSRSLTESERNYSQLDREALAIIFAVNKFFMYIYGRKFVLITDNRPLTHIFHQHNKLPAMTAARLLRYAVYLQGFNYEIKHRKNEDHVNVDYLSRFSIQEQETGTPFFLDSELSCCLEQSINQITSLKVTSEIIRKYTEEDELKKQILLSNSSLTDFTLSNGIIFRGEQVYIPDKLRNDILNELHSTHCGIVKMKQLARRYVYWPSMNKDIEKIVKSCKECAINQKSPSKVPTHKWDEPNENFERVHIDYASQNGMHFLILVDSKSKWPEVRMTRSQTTTNTILLLNDIFSTHGYPNVLVSDNATIFTNEEFKSYCAERGIHQSLTAPGHPATNGLAERYVQIIKGKLKKMENTSISISSKIQQILLQFRATPLQNGLSPAELYLGRKIRIRLDAIKPYSPPKKVKIDSPKIRKFSIGDRVISRYYDGIKSSWRFGNILKKFGDLHYQIKLDVGGTIKRHIDQIKPTRVPEKPESEKSVRIEKLPSTKMDIIYRDKMAEESHENQQPIDNQHDQNHQNQSPINQHLGKRTRRPPRTFHEEFGY